MSAAVAVLIERDLVNRMLADGAGVVALKPAINASDVILMKTRQGFELDSILVVQEAD